MRRGGYVAIGYPLGEDLSRLVRNQAALEGQIRRMYPGSDAGYIRTTLTQFVLDIARDDIVVAADGTRNLGIGRVVGDYEYDDRVDGAPPDRRKVDWQPLNPQVVWQAAL